MAHEAARAGGHPVEAVATRAHVDVAGVVLEHGAVAGLAVGGREVEVVIGHRLAVVDEQAVAAHGDGLAAEVEEVGGRAVSGGEGLGLAGLAVEEAEAVGTALPEVALGVLEDVAEVLVAVGLLVVGDGFEARLAAALFELV